MEVVPPLTTLDEKTRLIFRLPASVIEIFDNYSEMLEEAATAAGSPPKRRRGKGSGPAASTYDHVLQHMVTKVLAKDPKFVKWLANKKSRNVAASTGRPASAVEE